MRTLIVLLILVGASAAATEKTCKVKKMHCESCSEFVDGSICDDSIFSTCKSSILDEKSEIGQVHLVTKDQKAEIDLAGLNKKLAASGAKYEIDLASCRDGKPEAKASGKKKKKI